MKINFRKSNGLVPVIIQDETTLQVLMLGYMNQEAFIKTKKENKVTFFSRSKNRIWTKGESSGNTLIVKKIFLDCDEDTLLIYVTPKGPTCHTGATSCFADKSSKGFLYNLEKKISQRIHENGQNSYTNNLFKSGINKIAQKMGEEAIELVIEAKDNNKEFFKNEAADLLYHLLILLKSKDTRLSDIEQVLKERSM